MLKIRLVIGKNCFEPRHQGEANGRLCFLPLFANVIKNNITSSVIYIIVCLSKTE